MKPFEAFTGPASPLPFENIDTDQLIPARFMSRSRAEGYGDHLFYDLRRKPTGELDPGFPLNAPTRAATSIIVARRNFGCGSSREAAVYALVDAGVRVVVAPSFGDIFASNAVNNGLLPAVAASDAVEQLLSRLENDLHEVRVDLAHQLVTFETSSLPFEIDAIWKTKLLHGWDDLDLTMQHAGEIAAFSSADRTLRPWAEPMAPTGDAARTSG